MVPALLLTLLLGAPGKHWSDQHPVGVWLPASWKVLQRDEGSRVVSAEGPLIGQGKPRVALSVVGDAADTTLREVTDGLVKQVTSRSGWRQTVRKRKVVDKVWPAERVGIAFTTPNGVSGRARFTVVLLGARYYALEMSASARHFPGSTFDSIEKSLEVKWTTRKVAGGGSFVYPSEWTLKRDGLRFLVIGPPMGESANRLSLEQGSTAGKRHPREKPGQDLRFVGRKRATREIRDLEDRPRPNRLIVVESPEWTGVVSLAGKEAELLFPVYRRILAGVKAPGKG